MESVPECLTGTPSEGKRQRVLFKWHAQPTHLVHKQEGLCSFPHRVVDKLGHPLPDFVQILSPELLKDDKDNKKSPKMGAKSFSGPSQGNQTLSHHPISSLLAIQTHTPRPHPSVAFARVSKCLLRGSVLPAVIIQKPQTNNRKMNIAASQ